MLDTSVRSFRIIPPSSDYTARSLFALADFILLNISFFFIYYLKRGTFLISNDYLQLLLIFYVFWLLIMIVTKKASLALHNHYIKGIVLNIRSIIYLTYCISFLIVFTGVTHFSRIHIFGTCALMLFFDVFLFSLFFVGRQKDSSEEPQAGEAAAVSRPHISFLLIITDFILLSVAYFSINFFKRGTFVLAPEYEKVLLVMYGLWLIFLLITQKFEKRNIHSYLYALSACLKSIILISSSMAVIIYAFRLFSYSRFQVFGTLLLFLFLEMSFFYLYLSLKLFRDMNGDIESIDAIQEFLSQDDLPIEPRPQENSGIASVSFMKMLLDRYLSLFPQFSAVIKEEIDISNFDGSELIFVNSPDINDIKILGNDSAGLFINLYRLNDIRRINRYFLEVYKGLKNGGYFVGRADIISTHKKEFFKKYPKYVAEILYVFQFAYFRMLPKLPHLKKIYFAISKGKNRMISKAEVMGRLYFCGFEVVSEQIMGSSLIFLAQKCKTPSLDQNPSYSPLIKLERSGINGEMIHVYKFRTMYPYSEYLQEYIYKHQKLEKGGKIKDDFRVTDWGNWMRKYWIDELPMLYNWIKGELKLFGVRPLSKQYLSLYDVTLQTIRKKVKPGLIPPYYADMPKELAEINESEKRYINSYFERPLKTQLVYFVKAMTNIMFKGARSS